MTISIRRILLAVVLAARAWAAESPTIRAADAGVSPGFCPALRTLVDAAPGRFESVRGKARAGVDQAWDGTKRLPGATECTVFGGKPPAYACTLYAGDDEDGAYERAVSGVKDCLSGPWKVTEKTDGERARTTTAEGSKAPRIRVMSHDATGDAYLVDLWVDAPAH